MSEHAAVLFANETFYRAFADRDLDLMDASWARNQPVSCIHPGWQVLDGRDEVMESWEGILGAPEAPRITFTAARARLYGDVAVVTCCERLDEAVLAATNVFVREGGGWVMVHHQAGPGALSEDEDEDGNGAPASVN